MHIFFVILIHYENKKGILSNALFEIPLNEGDKNDRANRGI